MTQIVIVTGASSGIGAATARMLGAQGAHVVVNYLSGRDGAEAVAAEIERSGGRAIAVKADMASESDIEAMFKECDRAFGRLTGLVNNAAINTSKLQKIEDYTMDECVQLLRVNTAGLLICCREGVKRMSTANGGKGGSIVNVSSYGALTGSPGRFIHYGATKGAVDTATIGLATELVRLGVRVNGVRPGMVDTPIHAKTGQPNRVRDHQHTTPMGRAGRPEEVAESIVWLLSDKASFVTGTILNATGGAR
jgi:NAD(P)-dependent dehydrogenase (short-subunit alcohol dehydrogenase family)